jgi:putative membrane protein
LTDEAGLSDQLKPEQHLALTLVNHFAYGGAAGSIYGVIADKLPLPPIIKGIGFGLGVWTISYLGLLPALGILKPATQHPARRNVLMIVAHVIWGSVTGLVVEQLQ